MWNKYGHYNNEPTYMFVSWQIFTKIKNINFEWSIKALSVCKVALSVFLKQSTRSKEL